MINKSIKFKIENIEIQTVFEFFELIQDHLVLDKVEWLNPYYYLNDLMFFDYLRLFSKDIFKIKY